ncbi:hypothetical protein BH10ACT1_BH10ACT1_31210 [soil metagenome]
MTERVTFSEGAAELVRLLTEQHGPLMFHQSGGCCDGSSPMCYSDGEFLVGGADVRLGQVPVEGVERPVDFWMSAAQFDYWRHTHLTVDVVDGRGGGFSLESPEGKRFLIRSEVFTDEEESNLDPVVRGDQVDEVGA